METDHGDDLAADEANVAAEGLRLLPAAAETQQAGTGESDGEEDTSVCTMTSAMHVPPPRDATDGTQPQLTREERELARLLSEQLRLQQQVIAFRAAAQTNPQIGYHVEVLQAQMAEQQQQQRHQEAAAEEDKAVGAAEVTADAAAVAAAESTAAGGGPARDAAEERLVHPACA
jgi:hypothetical protein